MMQRKSWWLYNLSWEEVEELRDRSHDTIIIPVGSTEQHGGHLPLGTDSLLAIALAQEAAEKTGVPIAPPLYFGWSPHHLALSGTISIRAEVLSELLFDMFRSLAEHGFKRFLVINGHRIVNIPWIQIAAERAQRELQVRVFLFDPAYASKSLVRKLGFHGIGHADEIETSHMLYCYPELVHMDKAVDFVSKEQLPYSVDPADPSDTLCYVPSTKESVALHAPASKGSSGFPREASEEKGRAYHIHLVNFLVDLIGKIQKEDSL